MTDRVLVTDAVVAVYENAIRRGGIPYAILPDDHEGALIMLANVVDMSLGVMRYLCLQDGRDDEDLVGMMRAWNEVRLTEMLDRLYEESE